MHQFIRHISSSYVVFQDLPAAVQRVAKFYGKSYTDAEVERLCDHLSIDNFKNNKSVNYDVMRELGILIPGTQAFIRKGDILWNTSYIYMLCFLRR